MNNRTKVVLAIVAVLGTVWIFKSRKKKNGTSDDSSGYDLGELMPTTGKIQTGADIETALEANSPIVFFVRDDNTFNDVQQIIQELHNEYDIPIDVYLTPKMSELLGTTDVVNLVVMVEGEITDYLNSVDYETVMDVGIMYGEMLAV